MIESGMSIKIEAGIVCPFGCHLREEGICTLLPQFESEAYHGSIRPDKKWKKSEWAPIRQRYIDRSVQCQVQDEFLVAMTPIKPEFVE